MTTLGRTMKYHILGTIAVSTVLLTACEDSTATDDALDQANYNAFVDERNDAVSVLELVDEDVLLDAAPADDTLELSGVYTITASPTGSLVGEMSMDVDFGNETVSGTFSNSYLDPDGTDLSSVTELDGTVTYSGSIDMDRDTFYDSSNEGPWHIEGSSSGTFSDVTSDDDAVATTYRLDVDINGDFVDTSAVGVVDGVGEIGDISSVGVIEGSLDVTSTTDTTIYDVSSGVYFVYETVD